MGEVTRNEFEIYIRAQNGALGRIEKKLDEIDHKLERMQDAEKDCREDMEAKIAAASRGKVSWATMAIVSLLSASTIGLLTALVTHALK
jgi:hypothetical protein